jgi:uncharacterized protein GlcG (DUF336 family)
MTKALMTAALALALAAASPAAAQAPLPTERVLPVQLALEAAGAALAACSAQGYAVAVAVVDRKGSLTLLAADPKVSPISVELAPRKAHTAAVFGAPSGEIAARFRQNPAFAQGMAAVDPKLATAQGGVPIVAGGEMLGAMGISGAPGGDKDEACVMAGLAKIAERLR